MRLDDEAESTNYEVRSGGGGFGLPIGLAFGRGGIGCGGIVVLGILALVMGINPLSLIGVATEGQMQQGPADTRPGGGSGEAGEKSPVQSTSLKILGSTERVWGKIFEASGSRYEPTILAFYPGNTQSGCGAAQSAAGPFYCPADKRIYLDTSFFDELSTRFGAPGDFAQAYVIAHEVGHHIQDLEGRLAQVRQQQARLSEGQSNALQVKVELQADCYAGVWAANTKGVIEPGDIEEGLRAAAAVGDDTLQKASQGVVVPEGFTHGSAADRQKWLKKGLDSGDPRMCDTFGGA
ncbi:KPN_02809 family neutral zinc metallopeptidase [Sphingomonas montanisoli]|uniref:Zinc metalloprotease n=1 Tax=Sphingomonas montanisoli TaxID=2606412 RepID=A0A5D9C8U6_9SPHN|nr:neutral zinc metallopeptidase [Sphingomonas montanisoli]TZG26471.1 zinc metalloprotease [Sphingomonas montanisoli]